MQWGVKEEVLVYLYQKKSATPEEIAQAIRKDKVEVIDALSRLEQEGLVRSERKGFFTRKLVYTVTASGFMKGKELFEELQRKAQEINQKAEQGTLTRHDVEGIASAIPLMLVLGLLSGIALSSLITMGLVAYELAQELGGHQEAVQETSADDYGSEQEDELEDFSGDFMDSDFSDDT